MNVIVIGGGKVGFYLCKTLLEHGHQPLIIEKNKRTCEYASTQLDIPTINADGSTIEALTAANASRSDAVIAVTGLDQDNLISCQLAKEIFHVPKTVARVNNPKNAAVMKSWASTSRFPAPTTLPACWSARSTPPASRHCSRSTAAKPRSTSCRFRTTTR